MKIRYLIPFIIAGIFSIFILGYDWNPIQYTSNMPEMIEADGPINQKERLLWEFLRLRDPKTGKIPPNIKQESLEYAKTLSRSNYIGYKSDRLLSGVWNLRGPVNIGGRTRALALDVLDENIVIAGGVSGGMWRSTDAGRSWTKTTRPEQLHSTSCIAQDTRPGKENVWYMGTGEYFNIYGGLRGDGVYKSTDGGNSWFQLESTLSNTPHSWDNNFDYVWNIVTDHTNPDEDVVLTATAVGAIHRTTDGGETWNRVLGGFGNSYSWFTDLVITPSGIFYAALSQKTFGEATSQVRGIYRSTNGIEWINITPEFIPEKYDRIVIAYSPSDEKQVYFLAETPGTGMMTTNTRGDSLWHSIWKYTYLSGDGSGEGGIWEDRSSAVPHPERIRSQFNSQGGYDLVIKVKPDDPETVFIGGTNLYRSTDGFKTQENITHIGGYCWDDTSCYEIYTYTNHHADQHAIVFLPSNPNVMLTGSDGGVAITYNNMAPHVDWISLNEGYFTTQFYTCAIDHAIKGSPEIIGGLQDNGTLYTNSFDLQRYWNNAAGADGFHCAVADSGKAYYTSNNTSKQPFIKIWRTFLDEDGERTIRTRIDPDGAQDMIWNTPFRLDPNDSRRMYLAGGAILWRNNNLDLIPVTDSQDSTSIGWDSLSNTRLDSLHPQAYRGERITAVVVSKNPANIVYYGTSYGRVFRIDNAHEGDPIPVEITGDEFPGHGNVGCVAVDLNDANKVFTVFTNFSVKSIFYSTDAGESWTDVSGNLEQFSSGAGAGPAVYWLEVLPVGGRNLYFAGTSTGLYSTAFLDDDYTVWQQEAINSIGNMMVYMLDSRPSEGYLAAATYGNGMYSANYTSLPDLPDAPFLVSPNNDSVGVLKDITLTWDINGGPYFFHLQVAKDEDFNDIIYDYDGLREKEKQIFNLEQGMVIYYWRVFARASSGISEASETGTFITATAPPVLSYPENGTEELDVNLSLLWEQTYGADSYHIQLSENNFFTKLVVDTIVINNELTLENLENDMRYYWRASSIKDVLEGLFSDKYWFKTKKLIGVDDNSDNKEFGIINIASNPFSQYADVKFFLNFKEKINLSIYDLNGRKIKTFVNAFFAKGEHTYRLDCRRFNSGEYLLIMKSERKKSVQKVMIIK
jgi:hypothetical protein